MLASRRGRIDLKEQGGSSVGSTMIPASKPFNQDFKRVQAAVCAVKATMALPAALEMASKLLRDPRGPMLR